MDPRPQERQAEFEQALAAYRQLVVDMDGDGIRDAVAAPSQQQQQAMPQPTNAMMVGPSTVDVNSQLAETVVDRGNFVPLVEYGDGSFGAGLPGVIHGPVSAVNRMLTPGYDYSNTEQASRDAFDASGLAITGGIGAAAMGAYPRNSVGMAGSGWRGMFARRPPTPEPDLAERLSGQSSVRGRDLGMPKEEALAQINEQNAGIAQRAATAQQMEIDAAEAMRRYQARRAEMTAARQAEDASRQMTRGMSQSGQRSPLMAPDPVPTNRMLQARQSQSPLPGPSQSSFPSAQPPRELLNYPSQPAQPAPPIPPASGGPILGDGTSGGTLANPPNPQPTPNPGTSSAQTSRPQSVKYTQAHSAIMQKQFEDMMRGSSGNINAYGELDKATRSVMVEKLQNDFRASGLAVPSAENLAKRIDGTMQALADLQTAGANIRDPKVLRLAFGRSTTLGIAGGVPMGLMDREGDGSDDSAMGGLSPYDANMAQTEKRRP